MTDDRRAPRKVYVGDQMIEERTRFRFVYVNDEHMVDMDFDEAVLRAANGERLWTPWF